MAREAEEVPFTAYLPMHSEDAPKEAWLLDRAAGGEVDAWGALLVLHQERLKSIVAFRLDPRLRGRIDAADVMQEAFIAATTRREEFFRQSAQPLFLWLR
jgi:RNA polymerase sigma-70 factor (ECF subfamily)